MSKLEWERACAQRRGETVEEFRAWMKKERLVAIPCACSYENCKGWVLHDPELDEIEVGGG